MNSWVLSEVFWMAWLLFAQKGQTPGLWKPPTWSWRSFLCENCYVSPNNVQSSPCSHMTQNVNSKQLHSLYQILSCSGPIFLLKTDGNDRGNLALKFAIPSSPKTNSLLFCYLTLLCINTLWSQSSNFLVKEFFLLSRSILGHMVSSRCP